MIYTVNLIFLKQLKKKNIAILILISLKRYVRVLYVVRVEVSVVIIKLSKHNIKLFVFPLYFSIPNHIFDTKFFERHACVLRNNILIKIVIYTVENYFFHCQLWHKIKYKQQYIICSFGVQSIIIKQLVILILLTQGMISEISK